MESSLQNGLEPVKIFWSVTEQTLIIFVQHQGKRYILSMAMMGCQLMYYFKL